MTKTRTQTRPSESKLMNHNAALDALAVHQKAMALASGALNFKDSSQDVDRPKARRFMRWRRRSSLDVA